MDHTYTTCPNCKLLRSSKSEGIVLMDHTYTTCLNCKLLHSSKSEEKLSKEDCDLIKLADAAKRDEVEMVEGLVQSAQDGDRMLKEKMPFLSSRNILHICTMYNSQKVLEKMVTAYRKSVDVFLTDAHGRTALHTLSFSSTASYLDCYRAACSLLDIPRGDKTANDLLGIQDKYAHNTALSLALIRKRPDVGRALLDAADRTPAMKEKEGQTSTGQSADDTKARHWLTKKAQGGWVAKLYDKDVHSDEDPREEPSCTALHLAVWKGYSAIVRKILEQYSVAKISHDHPSCFDHRGNTPLHVAAGLGNSEICLVLLKHGAEGGGVDSLNKADETPLHIAATKGHEDVCGRLLEYGASLSARDKHGRFALTNAFAKGHGDDKVVKKLLDACLASTAKSLTADTPAETAESSHIDAKSKHSPINMQFEFGLTPLHVAVAMSSREHIKKLLAAGALVDCTNEDGRTPLHVSAQQYEKDSEVLRLLIESAKEKWNTMPDKKKADWINMKDIVGQTALHNLVGRLSTKDRRSELERVRADEEGSESSEEESSEEAESTVRKEDQTISTDIGEIRREETSAITDELSNELAIVKMCDTVRLLLSNGARVNVQDSGGETPLHVAARTHSKVLHCLLTEAKHPKNFRSGSQQPDAKNDYGHWICKCDFAGQTALHEAACAGCVDSVKHLLNQTKSPDDLLRVRDVKNMTALDWAARSSNAVKLKKAMMGSDGNHPQINDLTKRFLVWSLKHHAEPSVFAAMCGKECCKENEAKESQPSLLQAAVENKAVDIARELINGSIGTDIVTTLQPESQRWLAQKLGKTSSEQFASQDALGRRKLVQGVATLLMNPYTAIPITIGVFGSWGAGKSNFMQQVEKAILSMAIIETFRSTPYSSSPDETSSMTNFSRHGRHIRSTIVKALKHCLKKANKLKENAPGESKTGDLEIIKQFLTELQSTNLPLVRSLALIDRSKLMNSPMQPFCGRKVLDNAHFIAYTPAVLTLHYNAWQYDNKNEASAGLAIEVSKQLESFMTPQQWLRMCWTYSWKSRSREILAHLIFPILIGIVAVFVAVMLWKFVPIATRYKALSLPVGILGVIGALFKTCLEAIQPVTWTMLNLTKSFDHKSKLGYQHQVIADIKFLKDQLCEEAHFGWIVISFLIHLFISNTYFIEGTRIWRQNPSLKNFRIVVFIDDLDKCDEKSILEMLQAINLILGSCGIIVVIGVDKDMLQRALVNDFLKKSSDNFFDIWMDKFVFNEDKKPQSLVDNVDGKEILKGKDSQEMGKSKKEVIGNKYSCTLEFADKYMQKIIQLPIHLPDPSRKHIEQFLDAQFGQCCTSPKKTKGNHAKKDEDSQSKNSTKIDISEEEKDEKLYQCHHRLENGASELMEFRLLLANYTPLEKDMLKHLCQFTTKERNLPGEWKRILNYHQLAWSILSQDDNMKHKSFKGWQRKLILWIFICWNWKPQMDVIFQKWHELTSKSSKWKMQLHSQSTKKKDRINLGLGGIISTYLESMKSNNVEDIKKSMEKKEEEGWTYLQKVLRDEYDIPLHFVEKFQQCRFYCVYDHLEISEILKQKKRPTSPQ